MRDGSIRVHVFNRTGQMKKKILCICFFAEGVDSSRQLPGMLKSIFYKKGLHKSGRPLNLHKIHMVFM